MKYPVTIFSETDDSHDRERVKNAIVKLHQQDKLDFILAIDIGAHQVQPNQTTDWQTNPARYRHSPRTYELGKQLGVPVIGIDTWEKRVYLRDRVRNGEVVDQAASLLLRETRMVDNILKYGALGRCAVIVHDINLRGRPTLTYGDTSLLVKKLLCQPNVSFVPTPLSNRMDIIKVTGNSFNELVYRQIHALHNDLLDEMEQDCHSPGGLSHLYALQREELKTHRTASHFNDHWVVVKDSHIVSLVSVELNESMMYVLTMAYTRPAFRDNGYMSSLFRVILTHYCKDKHRLSLNVLVANDAAMRLYMKFGFKPVFCTMMIAE